MPESDAHKARLQKLRQWARTHDGPVPPVGEPRQVVRRRLTREQQLLAEAHLPIACRLAWVRRRRLREMVPGDDLVSESFVGLVYAASIFDPSKGVPFAAYATMVIKHRLCQYITRWLRRDRAVTTLSALDPTGELDAGDGAHLVADPAPMPDKQAADRELVGRVKELVPHSFDLLWDRFAVGRTMEELGDDCGITRQAIRHREKKAIRRLRGGLDCGENQP
jgi:RNA polymerase sigma factor (sigma-70 family)